MVFLRDLNLSTNIQFSLFKFVVLTIATLSLSGCSQNSPQQNSNCILSTPGPTSTQIPISTVTVQPSSTIPPALIPTKEEMNSEWVLVIDDTLNDRDNYKEINLSDDQWDEFSSEYELAVKNKLEWIKNPWGIVYKVAGYPSLDQINPIKVYVYYPHGNIAVAVLYDKAMDDSVGGYEWRIDLMGNEENWEIVWAGKRWWCRRTLLQEWTTDLCP
jgi:hypothetical protein